ncbi:MAG TPA: rod shape-determining protein MreC [Salinimicrobium sp.]|nr:rod shape-determining protein MreC [Salinimicrobium sp.]
MQQILNFLIKYKNTLIFFLLAIFSLYLIVASHSYHKSRILSSANFLTGTVFGWQNDVESYFYLEEYNERLLDENKKLREVLVNLNDTIDYSSFIDSTNFKSTYRIRTAEVISNNYSSLNNYITINQGKNVGVKPDYGVITSEGIVGVVENVSANYASVISILNSRSKINAKLQKSNHFGSLVWNGNDPNIVQLIDVPRLAPISEGDTVTTGGKSFIFPEGIPIGTVTKFGLDQNQSYFSIDVRLFNDMTNIGYVYIIENIDKQEIQALINPEEDE